MLSRALHVAYVCIKPPSHDLLDFHHFDHMWHNCICILPLIKLDSICGTTIRGTLST